MIEFRDATVRYPGTDAPAVDHFSHVFPSQRITALVGTSGCGKTTLLRMINRMVTPTSGAVLLDGVDVAGRDPVELRRSIGYVIQGSGLLPHRTVEQNIMTVPRLKRQRQGARELGELMEMVGLSPDLGRRYPAELSGGQAQRVGVARALAHDPDILLMDEPFGAVDPLIRRELQENFLGLQEELHKTIVLVTHDMNEAFRLADEVVLLSVGAHVEQVGAPEDLLTHPASDHVRRFIGDDARSLSVDPDTGVVRDSHGRVVGTAGVPDER